MQVGEVETDIADVELSYGISAGISLRMLHTELISLYEEHEARILTGMRLTDWEEMEYNEKVIVIALNRIRRAIKNQQSEAEIRESKRANRPKE